MEQIALVAPPTSRLPPIRNIASHPTGELSDALEYLRAIYNPEVRGSRRRSNASTQGLRGVVGDATSIATGINDLRADTFERSYAMRWLTALVSHAESWELDSEVTDTAATTTIIGNPTRQHGTKQSLVHDAAALLAVCSGTAAAGVVTRDFVFAYGSQSAADRHTARPGEPPLLKIHLTDVPLDNHDFGSVGAQTWGGACVLAEAIAEDPARFGLAAESESKPGSVSRGPLRILELGAGTGLVSLTVAKLLEHTTSSRRAIVIASDYYPSVLANLKHNISSNSSPSASSPASDVPLVHVSAHPLDWSTFPDEETHVPPFHEPFDLVLGADIVYEPEHAQWIKACLVQLLRHPGSAGAEAGLEPTFHLIIPLRRTHAAESGTIEDVFPRREQVAGRGGQACLAILDKETIVCDAGDGLGADLIEYAYYIIGWC